MPIPAATSYDQFLRSLLVKQVEDFDAPVQVGEVLSLLGDVDRHSADAGHAVPRSVLEDIRFLESHGLLEFDHTNPHVRLTALGVYTALLFDMKDSD